MSKTAKPAPPPTTTKTTGTDSIASSARNAQQQFLMAAAGMSWQLAIVVLVPVIGGFKLDEYLNTAPLCTAVGFVIAMIGMALVVWRQLQLFSPPIDKPKGGNS